MDPTALLNDIRDTITRMSEVTTREDWEEAAKELATQFKWLDDWLSKGGFLPSDWEWDRKGLG